MGSWLTDNLLEIFGAITGIIYVILEIRQTIWLWPLGIITSGVYVWIFFTSKLYADMGLQTYYVVISILGWYWWLRGSGRRAQGSGKKTKKINSPFEGGQGDLKKSQDNDIFLQVTRIRLHLAITLAIVFFALFGVMYFILSRLTDSPVPGWDSFLTSLSIIATWMLARKIYEHWYLWIVINIVSMFLYYSRGLFPTVALYAVYALMSFIGLTAWKKTIKPVTRVR
jgi:nicotinamide mononucleotide transporter